MTATSYHKSGTGTGIPRDRTMLLLLFRELLSGAADACVLYRLYHGRSACSEGPARVAAGVPGVSRIKRDRRLPQRSSEQGFLLVEFRFWKADASTGSSMGLFSKRLRKPSSIRHQGKRVSEILAAHEKFFRCEQGGVRANLSGANLSRADLRGINLIQAVLVGARLEGSSLHGSKLAGANLSRSNLRKADLRNCDLTEAHLQEADLSQADLSGTELFRADLRAALLRRARLRGTVLRQALLQGADLSGCDLTSASIRETDLSEVKLADTDVNKAVVRDAGPIQRKS